MALQVRKTVTVGGEDYFPGDVIPKEYEESPAHEFRHLIDRGDLDRVPDEILRDDDEDRQEGVQSTEEADRRAAHHILSGTVSDVRDAVEEVDSIHFLDVLFDQEKNHQERKTALSAIEQRRTQLYAQEN